MEQLQSGASQEIKTGLSHEDQRMLSNASESASSTTKGHDRRNGPCILYDRTAHLALSVQWQLGTSIGP